MYFYNVNTLYFCWTRWNFRLCVSICLQ